MVTKAQRRVSELEEILKKIQAIADIPGGPVWSPEVNHGKLRKIKKLCEKADD